jgi:rhodanese-related sulfurtransferase
MIRPSVIGIMAIGVLTACAQNAGSAKSVDDYKSEAAAAVVAVDVQSVIERVEDDSVIFVDVREADEVARLGKIAGAVHVPRGVLEFYIDPDSSTHLDIFSSGKQVIFYCATGGRSMLAAKLALDMGVADPVYLDGGFAAWTEAAGPTGH